MYVIVQHKIKDAQAAFSRDSSENTSYEVDASLAFPDRPAGLVTAPTTVAR